MSFKRTNKKTVSFRGVEEINIGNSNTSRKRSDIKKVSILKGKGKKNDEELKTEKTMEKVEEIIEEEKREIKEEKKEDEIKIEIPYQSSNDNNKMKYLPTDDYIKATVQAEIEQGLLNIAMLHPANPIKFLGNYLLEKSKSDK